MWVHRGPSWCISWFIYIYTDIRINTCTVQGKWRFSRTFRSKFEFTPSPFRFALNIFVCIVLIPIFDLRFFILNFWQLSVVPERTEICRPVGSSRKDWNLLRIFLYGICVTYYLLKRHGEPFSYFVSFLAKVFESICHEMAGKTDMNSNTSWIPMYIENHGIFMSWNQTKKNLKWIVTHRGPSRWVSRICSCY